MFGMAFVGCGAQFCMRPEARGTDGIGTSIQVHGDGMIETLEMNRQAAVANRANE